MPNAFQLAGAQSPPSEFSQLYTASIFSGLITNRNPISEGTVPAVYAKLGYGRQDSILYGQNTEISCRNTLIRRYGLSLFNSNNFPRINRYYAFNTFTIATESVRIMADTAATVYDITGGAQTVIFQKSAGAGSTYFLGVGNTLYFCNGVDNKQVTYNPTNGTWGPVTEWGINAPTTAPVPTQAPVEGAHSTWSANLFYRPLIPLASTASQPYYQSVAIVDPNGNWQVMKDTPYEETTGTVQPTFTNTETTDGTVTWLYGGSPAWIADHNFPAGSIISVPISSPAGTPNQMFVAISGGISQGTLPGFTASLNAQFYDGTGGLVWQNIGPTLSWANIGPSTVIPPEDTSIIVDSNGYYQTIYQQGKTPGQPPAVWGTEVGSLTANGTYVIWQNTGPFSVGGTAPVIYGYAYENSTTVDISNMSPKSNPITVIEGNDVTLTGARSTQAGVDTVVIYRTAQGGSTFLQLATIPNPPSGQWSYVDNTPDSGLNTELQAQVGGEGTPLPVGATCLAYHCGRIWAAVGNVIYGSSGPDAIVAGSSGNAGFDITFTLQSRITRFWVTSIGMIVFTVRDSYILLGNGAPAAAGGTAFYVMTYIENLPLLSYDAFTTLNTTAYMMTGKKMLLTLDPGAGIVEIGQPIADMLNTFNPASAYVTFHSQVSQDTALFVGNGQNMWLRMSPTSPPESGFNWSPPAYPVQGMSCLQSVETTPGFYELLVGPHTSGPILTRDMTVNTDLGLTYTANAAFGVLTLAHTGQLAGLAWMTLESTITGTAPALGILLDELSGTPENVPRTRQDPPNLPVSPTLRADRHSLLQNQTPTWCRHMLFEISWPAEAEANELISFAIMGETWNEMRSQ
jgi:hypothetical protein